MRMVRSAAQRYVNLRLHCSFCSSLLAAITASACVCTGPQLPPTAHKSKMLRRARSPPCLRNVFETRTVAEDNSYNASISSLPRQQRELPDRYRCGKLAAGP
jgi:hypothetical protein